MPPSIIGQVNVPENVSVVLKNPVGLICEASGIPLPAITWLKDARPVQASSSVRILSGRLHFDLDFFSPCGFQEHLKSDSLPVIVNQK